MKHSKLVRDKIPEMIAQAGDQAITRVLQDGDFEHELRRKLLEEVTEFIQMSSTEELADILEVVYALAAVKGIDPGRLEIIRQRKRSKKGGFDGKIFLVGTVSANSP